MGCRCVGWFRVAVFTGCLEGWKGGRVWGINDVCLRVPVTISFLPEQTMRVLWRGESRRECQCSETVDAESNPFSQMLSRTPIGVTTKLSGNPAGKTPYLSLWPLLKTLLHLIFVHQTHCFFMTSSSDRFCLFFTWLVLQHWKMTYACLVPLCFCSFHYFNGEGRNSRIHLGFQFAVAVKIDDKSCNLRTPCNSLPYCELYPALKRLKKSCPSVSLERPLRSFNYAVADKWW